MLSYTLKHTSFQNLIRSNDINSIKIKIHYYNTTPARKCIDEKYKNKIVDFAMNLKKNEIAQYIKNNLSV